MPTVRVSIDTARGSHTAELHVHDPRSIDEVVNGVRAYCAGRSIRLTEGTRITARNPSSPSQVYHRDVVIRP